MRTAAGFNRIVTSFAVGTVIAGAISVYLRTQAGSGPTKIDAADLAVLFVLAGASLALIVLTRGWRVAPWLGGLGILGWAVLLGPAGDTSCTDCGFVLLIPFGALGIQALLALLAAVVPTLRD